MSVQRSVLALLSALTVVVGAACGVDEFDAASLSAQQLAAETTQLVNGSNLFDELKGYASATSGGLGGRLYVVDSTADTSTAGTLRYGIEVLAGPTWIVFDPLVFPRNQKTVITVQTPLRLRSNLTIDERGSYISLRKNYDYSDAIWARASGSDVLECFARAKPAHDMGPILSLNTQRQQADITNVIISHLDFLKQYQGDPPVGALLDKQCFGDVITIINVNADGPLGQKAPALIARERPCRRAKGLGQRVA